jgi:hypothetical protein
MAMTASGLQAVIVSQITTQCGAAHLETTELSKFALAIATAVVSYIDANATVTVVTTCPAGSGAGTGTVS